MSKPTASNVKNVQVPGQPTKPDAATTEGGPGTTGTQSGTPGKGFNDADDIDALVRDTTGVKLPDAPKGQERTITLGEDDLNAMIDQAVNRRMRAMAAQNTNVPVAAELPDQADIDPEKIEREVLTKQGYVVPKNLGARPAHLSPNLT